jgi:DNA-binding CsgD family transcriptional regulator
MFNEDAYEYCLTAIQRSTSYEEVQIVLHELRDLYQLANVGYHGINIRALNNREPLILATYDPVWIQQYKELEHIKIDPILKTGQRSSLPIDWATVDRSSTDAKYYFSQLSRFNIGRNGITVQLANESGDLGFLSFSTHETKREEWAAFQRRHAANLAHFGRFTHAKIIEIAKGGEGVRKIDISRQSRSCLQLWSEGSSAKTIARELRISTSTVWKHLEHAKAALECRTKAQTLAKAARLGIISCVICLCDAAMAAALLLNDTISDGVSLGF